MGNIFGALGYNDTDRVFRNTAGQVAIYTAIADYVNRANADIAASLGIFSQGETDAHIERYYLPGSGRLQARGEQSPVGAVKATGSWDVAYPLYDFGAAIGGSDVEMAYMTAEQLSRHVQTVVNQNVNTVRFNMLRALLNPTNATFVDPLHGSLTVRRLANADGTSYPPVIGAETDLTGETHYLEAGYTAISDTNNPLVTINGELEEHFGVMQGGSNIACFINNAQRAQIEALTDFSEVEDRYVRVGADTDVAVGLPTGLPGTVIGRSNGVWVVEWRWIPSGYILGTHLDAPPPLKMRVDPADTGLGRGLQLVAQDEEFPMMTSTWRHRFGFGVANRLNGVVVEIANGGSYTTPTAYA